MPSPVNVRLLPPNRTALEMAVSNTAPLDLDTELLRTLWNPWTIPAALLPWLAWALSVDEWDAAWPESTQRAVCAASLPIHQHKGTLGAVRRVFGAVGYRGQIVEWWQQAPAGVPHTFRAEVEIDDRGIDDAAITRIERQLTAVKPERSHYTLRLVARSNCALRVACGTQSGEIVTLEPYQITEIEAPPLHAALGIGAQAWGTTTIYPQ